MTSLSISVMLILQIQELNEKIIQVKLTGYNRTVTSFKTFEFNYE